MNKFNDYKIRWYNISPLDENEEDYIDEEEFDDEEFDDIIDLDDNFDEYDNFDVICRECGEVIDDGFQCGFCGWIMGDK